MGKFSPGNLIKVPGRKSYHDMILETTGLVSYWNFGAGAGNKVWDQIDTSHGTISGATWTQESNGRQTLSFDGNDYVRKGVAGYRSGDSQGTVSAWVKLSALGTTQYVFSSADQASGNFIMAALRISSTNNITTLQRQSSSTNDNLVSGNTTFTTGTWYQVVAVSDGSTYSLYVNGQVESLTTDTGSNNGNWFADTSNRDNWVIGVLYRSTLAAFFTGEIKNVAIYNVPLTPETISKHYQVGVWEGLAEV